MCGRFTWMYMREESVRLYRLTDKYMSNLQPRYNICQATPRRRRRYRARRRSKAGLIAVWYGARSGEIIFFTSHEA
jgi:putative SOS response-associated peptidase YedK